MGANTILRERGARQAAPLFTYLLLGDLRELLLEPESDHTRRALLVFLDFLLDELPDRSRPEQGAEFLGEVLDEFPNWAGQVEALRCGEAADYARLAELRDALRWNGPSAALAGEIARDLAAWLESVAAHAREEQSLVQMAVNRDVGGEA
jgi:hypothetical protein